MSSSKLARTQGRLCLLPSSHFSTGVTRQACVRLRLKQPISANAAAAIARYYASKSYPDHRVIHMPALSPTMQAGNIGTWQKKAGDKLSPGDVLVEIETDKAQMDFEFQDEGVLAKILKDSGEKDVAVGNPIAVMVDEGEDVAPFENFSLEDAGGEKKSSSGGQSGEEASKKEDQSSDQKDDSDSSKKDSQQKSAAPSSQESDSTGARLELSIDREKIGPALKRLAKEKGIPISQVKGTGPNGQITKSDIEKYQPTSSTGSTSATAAVPGAAYEDTPASSMRKTIAARLTESMQQSPHYFVSSSVSVTKLLKLRAALNASADGKYKLSVNDFLIKALAVACRRVPTVNSSWRQVDGQPVIRKHNVVDVSVAVATPIGLMTPIVKNVGALGLESISAQVKELGGRARDGKLKPEEYQGGTITISNMGMNPAIERFTAVINPPSAAIVAVGAVKKVAIPATNAADIDGVDAAPVGVEWDDQIVFQTSFDHRVVDGAVGGEWMRELKNVLENPLELLL